MKKMLSKGISFLHKNKAQIISLILYAVFVCSTIAYAGETGDAGGAEERWTAVIDFIIPWIQRLGGVVILIGAVEFGLAFKNDDAEGKTKGMRTVIAGCIVFAVGTSSSVFLG